MKKLMAMILALVMVLSLAACGAKPAEAPEAEAPAKQEDGTDTGKGIKLRILWQQEVTETFMDLAVEKMQEKYPDMEIELNVSPEAYSEINNQMASKNAPDIFFSWASDVDFYAMAKDGMLNSVDDVMAAKTLEGDMTLGERLNQAGLEAGHWDGKHYLLPLTQYIAANFYDNAFMAEQGIDPATLTTMDGFLAACAKLKENGVDPMIYSGVYAFMVHDALLYPWIAAADPEAAAALNEGKKGAWLNENVVAAVQTWEDMIKAGYVTENSLPMDHIQSQIDFINHNEAFIPVGTWLEGEMAGQWPDDFELTPFFAPTQGGQAATPIIEMVILPKQKDDTNLPYVIELLQYFYSLENGKRCLEETGALMAYQNVPEDMLSLLPDSYQKALVLQEGVTQMLPSYRLTNKALFSEITNAVNAMTAGEMTAQEFCEKLDSLS